jgi:hypothetical protein
MLIIIVIFAVIFFNSLSYTDDLVSSVTLSIIVIFAVILFKLSTIYTNRVVSSVTPSVIFKKTYIEQK